MAFTLISHKQPPDTDPTKARLAFGDRAIPKLYRELDDADLKLRQRTLKALLDEVHNPESITEAVNIGIVTKLKSLLKDEDAAVRVTSSEVLLVMSGHAIGRTAIFEHEIVPSLTELFDDRVYEVRRNAHGTIEMASHSPPGPQEVVDWQVIPELVPRLYEEHDEIKEIILDTLHNCMKVETDQVLGCKGMEALTSLLSHASPVIRSKTARDIMDLSFPLDGKNAACNCGTVALLTSLLIDENDEVRIYAAGALMAITVTTTGKYAALQVGAIGPTVALLEDKRSEVRLNALKTITTLSEAPVGRAELRKSLYAVKRLLHDDESAAVRKAAQIAVKSITWEP